MSKYRMKAKPDGNQSQIVEDLRKMGYSVETRHDDILVGKFGRTFWYEVKTKKCLSKKDGKIIKSAKRKSQKILEKGYQGHYVFVTSTEEILADIKEQML